MVQVAVRIELHAANSSFAHETCREEQLFSAVMS